MGKSMMMQDDDKKKKKPSNQMDMSVDMSKEAINKRLTAPKKPHIGFKQDPATGLYSKEGAESNIEYVTNKATGNITAVNKKTRDVIGSPVTGTRLLGSNISQTDPKMEAEKLAIKKRKGKSMRDE